MKRLILIVAALSGCSGNPTDELGSGGSGSGNGGAATTGGAQSAGGASASGGASSGGAPAAGGKAAGGKASAGGSVSSSVVCDTGAETQGTPSAACTFAAPNDTSCRKCMTANCCAEVKACQGTNPSNVCAFGGLGGEGEFACYESCILDRSRAGGGVYSEADVDACVGLCATAKCGKLIGNATNEIIACVHINCEGLCFEEPLL